jgi:hypothetical protein
VIAAQAVALIGKLYKVASSPEFVGEFWFRQVS